jgi:phosphatidylserine/phosphatidylglycerophosphate/cardiolipin synthase-like enzyme
MGRHRQGGRVTSGLLTLALFGGTALPQEVHYAPEEDLSVIDVTLINSAQRTINLASYSLTEPHILRALQEAEKRGVVVRIVLDPREPHDFLALVDLADNVRIKRGGPLMHLKAFEVDESVLRTGSANFSAGGERRQDNDLVVIHDMDAVVHFNAHFERMWRNAMPAEEFDPAVRAMEPK